MAAALSVAPEQGLPAEDPRVLSSRGNLPVHLAPAPAVARVATLAAYAAVTGTPPPASEALIPYARARELEAAVWSLGLAHQYPRLYAAVAHDLLAAVLRTPPSAGV